MKIKGVITAACAALILGYSFGYSASCAAQEIESCREQNIKLIIRNIELSQQGTGETSKILLEKLKHQLQAQKKLRALQTSAGIRPANDDILPTFEPCSECSEDGESALK